MNFSDFFSLFKQNKLESRVLSGGSFNEVSVTEDEIEIDSNKTYWVVKKALDMEEGIAQMNRPHRAIRKLNTIYPDVPCAAFDDKYWSLPFFSNQKPSDKMIAKAIVDIYQRTGNIVADGNIIDNFVVHDGKALLIDYDLTIHRNSETSEWYFNRVIAHPGFDNFFKQYRAFYLHETCEIIKTLFYMEDCLGSSSFDNSIIHYELIRYLHHFRILNLSIDWFLILLLNSLLITNIPVPNSSLHPDYLLALKALEPDVENALDLVGQLNLLVMQMGERSFPKGDYKAIFDRIFPIPQLAIGYDAQAAFFSGLKKRAF